MSGRTLGGVWAFRRVRGVQRGECTWCRRPVPPRRQTWCDDPACLHEYKVRNDPGYARDATFARDRGVCGGCSLDTEAVRAELGRLLGVARALWMPPAVAVVVPAQVIGGVRWERHTSYERSPVDYPAARAASAAYSAARAAAGAPRSGDPERLIRPDEGVPHLWEMDHIVPVVEGGGGCGLDNLRTLCLACHRAETAALAARRARSRRVQGELFAGGAA